MGFPGSHRSSTHVWHPNTLLPCVCHKGGSHLLTKAHGRLSCTVCCDDLQWTLPPHVYIYSYIQPTVIGAGAPALITLCVYAEFCQGGGSVTQLAVYSHIQGSISHGSNYAHSETRPRHRPPPVPSRRHHLPPPLPHHLQRYSDGIDQGSVRQHLVLVVHLA